MHGSWRSALGSEDGPGRVLPHRVAALGRCCECHTGGFHRCGGSLRSGATCRHLGTHETAAGWHLGRAPSREEACQQDVALTEGLAGCREVTWAQV